MTLTCKVVGVHSGDIFLGHQERITVRISEADNMFCEIRLIQDRDQPLKLNDTFTLSDGVVVAEQEHPF